MKNLAPIATQEKNSMLFSQNPYVDSDVSAISFEDLSMCLDHSETTTAFTTSNTLDLALPCASPKKFMLFGEPIILNNSADESVSRIQGTTMEYIGLINRRDKEVDNIVEEPEDERRAGIFTELTLRYEDPWKITKELTSSDIGGLCRLLVSSKLIKKHILTSMSAAAIDQVKSRDGARVTVWDMDTWTEHAVVFKQWSTSKGYVFVHGWSQHFVRRRNLKRGDEIGLYWDAYYARFHFAVLRRAP